MNINKLDLAWVAGLIDGEGCFYVNTNKGTTREYKYPAFALNMCDDHPVLRLAVTLSLCNVHYITRYDNRDNRPEWRGRYEVKVYGLENVQYLLCLIWEFISDHTKNKYIRMIGDCLPVAP